MTEGDVLIYIVSILMNLAGVIITYIILGSICNGDLQPYRATRKRKRRR